MPFPATCRRYTFIATARAQPQPDTPSKISTNRHKNNSATPINSSMQQNDGNIHITNNQMNQDNATGTLLLPRNRGAARRAEGYVVQRSELPLPFVRHPAPDAGSNPKLRSHSYLCPAVLSVSSVCPAKFPCQARDDSPSTAVSGQWLAISVFASFPHGPAPLG